MAGQSRRFTLKSLTPMLVWMGSMSATMGYANNHFQRRYLPLVHVWNELILDSDIDQPSSSYMKSFTKQRSSDRVAYDLGLGKHPSLLFGALLSKNTSPESVQEAVRYLMESESVRQFPSPLVLNNSNTYAEFLLIPAHPVVYDLGLGRNPSAPKSFPQTQYFPPRSIHEAARYLPEYESVHQFPSPILLPDSQYATKTLVLPARGVVYDLGSDKHASISQGMSQPGIQEHSSSPSAKSTPATKKKVLTFIHPNRHTTDIFHIIVGQNQINGDKNDSTQSYATLPQMGWITSKGRHVKVDPNTVWVEMLLHNQELQEQMELTDTAIGI